VLAQALENMRFAVPQFIEVEDKIFGPLTLKQAIYLAGGAGFALAIFVWKGFFLALLLGAPVFLFTLALSFVKVNNQPFVDVVYAAVFYTLKNKLYLWKRTPNKHPVIQEAKEEEEAAAKVPGQHAVPKLTQSKLREIAWTLDTRQHQFNEDV
jgi:hypothetical protein